MWAEESVFYQIYPLGMTGAPFENDGILTSRITKLIPWMNHFNKLGIDAIYFSPIFESDTHGYNTRDYQKIDCRLGSNKDFVQVTKALHQAGIKVVIDGVFNHVGRGFFGFSDVLKQRENSPYKDWFFIDFNNNNGYNDGLSYEGWEGCMDLVKLNLKNPAVTDYLLKCIHGWIDEFDIDGLRLDVAYMLDHDFLRLLRQKTNEWKKDFFLIGEMIHGDYNQIANQSMCHSVTNYECYKGIYSSLNSDNLFEIVHSLLRQFGPEEWTLYKGTHPVSFVDNHDVSRIASTIEVPEKIPLAFALMYGMPGIPMIYYGSEWGQTGLKEDGDQGLRPAIDTPSWNLTTDKIASMNKALHSCKALSYGDFTSIILENRHCIFRRSCPESVVYVGINEDCNSYIAHFDSGYNKMKDILTGESFTMTDGIPFPSYSARFLIPATESEKPCR